MDLPTVSRDRPLPGAWIVARGVESYLAENGFRAETYAASRAPISLLGLNFSIPNPPSRRWAVKLHDLHHVATGFGTDPAGEGQISAWECRRGLRGLGVYVGAIVLSGCALGLLVAPRKTLRAWRAARRGNSLFNLDTLAYEELLSLSIAELREMLDVPAEGLHRGPRGVHSGAPRGPRGNSTPPCLVESAG